MAKKDRLGKRKDRKTNCREYKLGNYLVVTDTDETEKNYFEGFVRNLGSDFSDKIRIKVSKAKTSQKVVDACKNLLKSELAYCEPWIVMDRDQVKNFDKLVELAEKEKINFAWSNPCIEIWLHSYYGNPVICTDSVVCCNNFKHIYKQKNSTEYNKNDKNIYEKLIEHGSEEKAIMYMKNRYNNCQKDEKTKPTEMEGCSLIYMLIEKISDIVKKNG